MNDRIMQLFAHGMPPSRIDRTLKLPSESARKAIVGAWLAEKEGRESRKPEKPRVPQKRRFSTEVVKAVRAADGELSVKQAAITYGVSESTVRRIWNGELYREVK